MSLTVKPVSLCYYKGVYCVIKQFSSKNNPLSMICIKLYILFIKVFVCQEICYFIIMFLFLSHTVCNNNIHVFVPEFTFLAHISERCINNELKSNE